MFSLFFVASLGAQEQLRLTNPVNITRNVWTIASLIFDVENSQVVITVKSNDGIKISRTYGLGSTPSSITIFNVINTANLSSTCANQAARGCGSLRRRVFDRLRDDGVLIGDLEGTP